MDTDTGPYLFNTDAQGDQRDMLGFGLGPGAHVGVAGLGNGL